ncbi:MAG: insulinase family protein [Chitinophagales bacterium]|nr:insulinase family protein [Chitinophagales bacterium]MDW8418479.1 pitrilysin family protein [Chitinophagales bacterium]
MPNRTVAPPVQPITELSLLPVHTFTLDNKVPVYAVSAGEQDVVKIELFYRAGLWYEPAKLISQLTNRMLREGTRSHTGKELADNLEYYGVNLDYACGVETAGATLFGLSRHIPEVLPLLAEIFTEPAFPDEELATVTRNQKQRLLVNLQKNDFVAGREFHRALFGHQHPYGKSADPEDYDSVCRDDLNRFFQTHYHTGNLQIILAGKLDDSIYSAVNRYFGQLPVARPPIPAEHTVSPSQQQYIHLSRHDSVQSSIAMGHLSISKTHPDFLELSVVNTLLGGYFGSRLMKNIREEKGYTYGIFSSLVSYPRAGYWEITADVGKEVCHAAIEEIQNEIHLLQNEPVPEDELQTVQNYLSGRILRSVDGPFKYAETLKNLIIYNLNTDYIHQTLHAVRSITPARIMQLSNQYLNPEKMYRVIVG